MKVEAGQLWLDDNVEKLERGLGRGIGMGHGPIVKIVEVVDGIVTVRCMLRDNLTNTHEYSLHEFFESHTLMTNEEIALMKLKT